MKKSTALLVALLAAALLFAGGSGESAASDSGKIQLTFFETMTSPGRTQVLQDLIAEYESLNPNIEIELISPPYEQADNRLSMMLNSNQELDVIEVRDYTQKQFVNNGKLLDLTPYLENWEESDDFLPVAHEIARNVDDTPYILTSCLYVKALLVRTDILEQYGIEIPTTMDEMYEASKELSQKAPNQFGYALRGKSNTFKISDVLMFGNVGNIDTENCYQTTDGKYWLDNENGKKAMEQYVDLFKNGCPPDSINWGFNEQINGFISGTTPFLVQDPDVIGSLEGQLDPDCYTVVPLPVGTSGYRYLDYGYNGFAISTASKHPDEAWDFIAWLNGAEKNAEFCKAYGPLPVFQSIYDNDDYFSSDKYQAWADELVAEDTIFVKFPIDSEKYPAWAQIQEQGMQAMLMGNVSVEDTINTFKEYWGY